MDNLCPQLFQTFFGFSLVKIIGINEIAAVDESENFVDEQQAIICDCKACRQFHRGGKLWLDVKYFTLSFFHSCSSLSEGGVVSILLK